MCQNNNNNKNFCVSSAYSLLDLSEIGYKTIYKSKDIEFLFYLAVTKSI